MCTAETIWKERNTANDQWIDSDQDLKERKQQAQRTNWRHSSNTARKVKRISRLGMRLQDRDTHKKQRAELAATEAREQAIRSNKRKAEQGMITAGEERINHMARQKAAKEKRKVAGEHRPIIKRARMAGNTPDLQVASLTSDKMHNTEPKHTYTHTGRTNHFCDLEAPRTIC